MLMLRLVRCELLKLRKQKMTLVFFALIAAAAIMALAVAKLKTQDNALVGMNGFLVLAYAFKYGFTVTMYFLVIYSALSFSAESHQGTMRMMLARPVRRIDLYVAKMVSLILLALIAALVVAYVGLLVSAMAGEFGPVRSADFPLIVLFPVEELHSMAINVFFIALPPLLAAACFALLLSVALDNSAMAVGLSILLFVILDLVMRFLGPGAEWIFTYYPAHYTDSLAARAEGFGDVTWTISASTYWIPLVTAAVLAVLPYPLFLRRNITT